MRFSAEKVKEIQDFILKNIERSPSNISELAQSHFGISKPTAFKYLTELQKANLIKITKKGRYPNYVLVNKKKTFRYTDVKNLSEEKILINDISPLIKGLKKNVVNSFDYAVSEIVNNAIDHSGASEMRIVFTQNAAWTQIAVCDNGIGIFNKIQKSLKLDNPGDALIELSKGKFTSDPEHHSGEGIFFTSKICDDFKIVSGGLSYKGDKLGAVLENAQKDKSGTSVYLKIYNDSKTQSIKIFDEYSDLEKTPSFYKTKISVKLLESDGVILVSRSQAKRLYRGFEKFSEVVLDFAGVTEIGQGFADELFRVFTNKNPAVRLVPVNCCKTVQKMILHVGAK